MYYEGDTLDEQRGPRSVEELMNRYAGHRSRGGLQPFAIRLSAYDNARLGLLASKLDVPKTTLARDLLKAAVNQAIGSVQFRNDGEEGWFYEALEHIERADEIRREMENEDYSP
jgi:hypothetical protein